MNHNNTDSKTDPGRTDNPPARSDDAREKQLIAKAMGLAEKQLDNGTASSQIVTHFLKLGSSTERLIHEKLQNEIRLMTAKIENLDSNQKVEELYKLAMTAMRQYTGDDSEKRTNEEG